MNDEPKNDEPKPHRLKAEPAHVRVTGGEAKLRVFSALPDEHPFYEKIGRIVAGMAQFEHVLDSIIWELLGLAQAEGSRITARLIGFRPRFEAIEDLWLGRD